MVKQKIKKRISLNWKQNRKVELREQEKKTAHLKVMDCYADEVV
jgi:hypothetical protein